MTPTTDASYLGDYFPLSELMTRFRSQWSRQRQNADTPVTRIASFNLLVVSNGQDEEQLGNILEDLKESHPARVVWAKIEEGREWEDSRARLHLGCRCQGDQVCTELIQICCGRQPARVASIILPLIRAGLPTHLLWWNAGETGGPLFERLSDRAKLILLASQDWKTMGATLPALWGDPHRAEHSFYPLAWFQAHQARQSVAKAYSHSDIELRLPSAKTPGSVLLEKWLVSSLSETDGSDFSPGPGYKISSHTKPTSELHWSTKTRNLELDSELNAIRKALDNPHRDRVFERLVTSL